MITRRDRNSGWLPRRFGHGLTAGVVAGITLVGFGASAALYLQAERIADRQEATLAVRAIRTVQGINTALAASLGGASAMVDEQTGEIDEVRFDSFASGVVNTTLLPVLANVQLVPDARRAEIEAAIGVPITQWVGGSLVSSEPRDQYLVIRFVYPRSPTSLQVLGFDVGSEPIRAAAVQAANASGTPAFSAPLRSQPSGQIGVFAVAPLYRPGVALGSPNKRRGDPVGYVSSLVPADSLLVATRAQLPGDARVRIVDDGTVLAETSRAPTGGHTMTIVQANRTWVVTVEYHVADHSSAVLALLGALLLATAVGVSLWRNMRQTDELRRAALGVRRLGELSERLAVADSLEDVIRVVLAGAAGPARAASVIVALPSADRSSLATRHSGETEVVEERVAEPSPVTDAWNTRTPVFVTDEAAFRGLYAGGAQQRSSRGVASTAALPLRRPDGELVGVLGWEWSSAQRFGDGERSSMQATADLVQQSIERSHQREQRWASATGLLVLSQRLSVARTISQVAGAVIEAAPAAARADYVGVGLMNETGGAFELFHPVRDPDPERVHGSTMLPVDLNGTLMAVLRRGQPIEFQDRSQIERFPVLSQLIRFEMERLVCMPLIDSTGQLRGVLAFVFVAGSSQRRPPEAGRLATIADVTAQTVERAMLYLQEHELVVNLQRQTLADLPTVAGVDMAARYLPSSATLGLGGDWYDVYLLGGGRIGAVVGDVSGHGIDAIADMTEFRTTISTLLRTDQPLGSIPAMSTALLRQEVVEDLRFATAGLLIIEPSSATLSYIRAGHPPMLVRHRDGTVEVLESGGGGPIGVTDEHIDVQTLAVPPGTVVIAYTDGLVERREESIDVGLQRLCAALAECQATDAEEIADVLVARCLGGRQTADDTALLVLVIGESASG